MTNPHAVRNRIAIGLTVVSLVLLVPGLRQDLLTITASVPVMGTPREIFRLTQSILETVRSLHKSGNDFVAALILLFSVVIPFLKAIAFFAIVGLRRPAARTRLYLTVRALSKWSMADVFVVGVFIAYLAASATDNLGAVLAPGFYYFAAYCLVSNLAFQLLHVPESDSAGKAL